MSKEDICNTPDEMHHLSAILIAWFSHLFHCKTIPNPQYLPHILKIPVQTNKILGGMIATLFDRGREDALVCISPPSEPYKRISRIPLSG
jgi:hypothetical protein